MVTLEFISWHSSYLIPFVLGKRPDFPVDDSPQLKRWCHPHIHKDRHPSLSFSFCLTHHILPLMWFCFKCFGQSLGNCDNDEIKLNEITPTKSLQSGTSQGAAGVNLFHPDWQEPLMTPLTHSEHVLLQLIVACQVNSYSSNFKNNVLISNVNCGANFFLKRKSKTCITEPQ